MWFEAISADIELDISHCARSFNTIFPKTKIQSIRRENRFNWFSLQKVKPQRLNRLCCMLLGVPIIIESVSLIDAVADVSWGQYENWIESFVPLYFNFSFSNRGELWNVGTGRKFKFSYSLSTFRQREHTCVLNSLWITQCVWLTSENFSSKWH